MATVTTALAERLAERTLELIDIPSQSRDESALASHVSAALERGGVAVREAGDSCLLAGATERSGRPLVLLAGHFDTVPAQGNIPGRRDAGAVLGLGASDMKGALAVMIELAIERASEPAGDFDAGFVFFPREELPFTESALGPLLERERGLIAADLAVVMEPTANVVQAGCLGNVNATWSFQGRSGHSARPWLADNAIHRAARAITELASLEPVDHDVGGLSYREVVSVTRVEGGIARNVVPGSASAHVNYRYAPGTDGAAAEHRLHVLCDPHGQLVIDGHAPSGAVPAANAIVDRLIAISGHPVEPKQAWTPVAEFAMAGVDAVNFGPGDPPQAHTRGEQITVDALVRCHEALKQLLSGSPA